MRKSEFEHESSSVSCSLPWWVCFLRGCIGRARVTEMQGGRSGGGLPYEDLTRNSPKEAAVVGLAWCWQLGPILMRTGTFWMLFSHLTRCHGYRRRCVCVHAEMCLKPATQACLKDASSGWENQAGTLERREGKGSSLLLYYEKLEAHTRVDCMVPGIPATHHPASAITDSRPVWFHLNALHSSLTSDIQKQNPDSNYVFHKYFSIWLQKKGWGLYHHDT